MKHNVLGGIVKRINYKFSMETFQDRLKLQKHIYLLKAFGLDLGYNYNWYLFGPYAPTLTKDGFELAKDTSSSEEVKFQKPENEKRFMEYLKFVDTKKDDAGWLELVASIHFLKTAYPTKRKAEIIEQVMDKQSYFNNKVECESAWDQLKERGL